MPKNSIEIPKVKSRVIALRGNSPRKIEDNGQIWLILENSADIFAVNKEMGNTVGTRFHMLHLDAGDLFFGCAPVESNIKPEFYVTGSEGTRAACISPANFKKLIDEDKNGEYAAKVDKFIKGMAHHISSQLPPRHIVRNLDVGKNIQLPHNLEAGGPQDLIWFVCRNGELSYGGNNALQKLDNGLLYPLPPSLWLSVKTDSILDSLKTDKLLKVDKNFTGIANFWQCVQMSVFEDVSATELRRWAGFRQQQALEEKDFSLSLKNVGTILDKKSLRVDEQDPLVKACQIIGDQIGATIKAPATISKDSPVESICRFNKLRCRKVKLYDGWESSDNGPLIGFMKSGEQKTAPVPVALLGFSGKGYIMVNPAEGKKRHLRKDEVCLIDHDAYMIYAGFPARPLLFKDLFHMALTAGKSDFITVIVAGIASALLGFALPVATAWIIDEVVVNGDIATLGQIAFGLFFAVIGSGVFVLTRSIALLRFQGLSNFGLQSAVFDRVMSLPLPFFRKFSAGDLSRRALVVENLQQIITGQVLTTALAALTTMLNIILMLIYIWQLGLLCLGMSIVSLLFIFIVLKKQMAVQMTLENILGKLYGMELQFITGITKLRVAGAEKRAFARWITYYGELRRISFGVGLANCSIQTFAACLPILFYILVIFIFTASGLIASLSLGTFLCFNAALGQFTAAVISMCGIALSLVFVYPMYMRAKPILDTAPEVTSSMIAPGELKGKISMQNVSFTYEGTSTPVLRSVNLEINPGEFVAIVGPSGAGKSTILRLLLRFDKASGGTILFDGQDIHSLDIRGVREQIGTVLQNDTVMQGNIFQNIVGSSTSMTINDAWDAAELAGLAQEIREMPMQMFTYVPHGGSTLSGGQKQRLLIARAIAKKPRMLFFDEATSSLDNESQAVVARSLEKLKSTRICIAHRLNTVRHADRILVVYNGQIVQAGTFSELMKNPKGMFAVLANRQML
ncbi:MAG: NHLP bacteriocin export ABC transporter permease/ATPase subunit [Lentisphaerae bacterium GWF2_44_16]|nr:MAG: NHLP bacteriocin export ABC transporter permease/ATPase subunit [Lentisphaerae bacterium GWF2_44_16]